MEDNKVWILTDRLMEISNGERLNIIDPRFKRKIEASGEVRHKARLVTRGFKDSNNYELRETYLPVSRLSLVKTVIVIINKYNLNENIKLK